MAFKKVNNTPSLNAIEYNSEEAKLFLNDYKACVEKDLLEKSEYTPSKTFAPSSIRCKRQQWFRLRGTAPDKVIKPDTTLNFIANVGTDCHKRVQQVIKEKMPDKWVNVVSYVSHNKPDFDYVLYEGEYEARIKFSNPPVNFSCDGLLNLNDTIYLLEIKTTEPTSMKSLVGIKSEHLDQVQTYCTLLNIDNAIVMYVDRLYGELKCFTYRLSDVDKRRVINTFEEVMLKVEQNIIPEGLPQGDKWCNASYCKYFKSCRRWAM